MKKYLALLAIVLSTSAIASEDNYKRDPNIDRDRDYDEVMPSLPWECKVSDNSYAGAIWNNEKQSFTFRYVWDGEVICESDDPSNLCATPLVAKTPWGYTKGEMIDNSKDNIYRICRTDRAHIPGASKNQFEVK